jgi:NADH-quinone oxidoreductase subunit E
MNERHDCSCGGERAGLMDQARLREIIAEHNGQRGGLITILERVQSVHGYLPRETLEQVAAATGRSLVDVYGVATFYKAFSLTPRGKHLVSACIGTACHVRGAPLVQQELEEQLGVGPGQTTEDKDFTLETVNCLGACALGPVVVVDGRYSRHVDRGAVAGIIEQARNGADAADLVTDERVFPLSVSCSRCNHSLMEIGHLIDGHPAIRLTASFGSRHGWLRMSSLYGSHSVESKYPVPQDTVVHLFCPHCHAQMVGALACIECGSPMASMIVRGGGVVQICTRAGCPGHVLDVG